MATVTPSAWLRLLKSQQYADFTIVCSGVEFIVHRAVVCPASPVLDEACSGNFQEAVFHRIEFPDENPQIMARVILFMYTSDYDADMVPSFLITGYHTSPVYQTTNVRPTHLDARADVEREQKQMRREDSRSKPTVGPPKIGIGMFNAPKPSQGMAMNEVEKRYLNAAGKAPSPTASQPEAVPEAVAARVPWATRTPEDTTNSTSESSTRFRKAQITRMRQQVSPKSKNAVTEATFRRLEVNALVYSYAGMLGMEQLKAFASQQFLRDAKEAFRDIRFAEPLRIMYESTHPEDMNLRLMVTTLLVKNQDLMPSETVKIFQKHNPTVCKVTVPPMKAAGGNNSTNNANSGNLKPQKAEAIRKETTVTMPLLEAAGGNDSTGISNNPQPQEMEALRKETTGTPPLPKATGSNNDDRNNDLQPQKAEATQKKKKIPLPDRRGFVKDVTQTIVPFHLRDALRKYGDLRWFSFESYRVCCIPRS